MDLTSFRKSRGLSLEECARQLGLQSRGHLHDLESGRRPFPMKLALQIEIWSEGAVTAVELLQTEEADALRAVMARNESAEAQP